MSPSPKGPIRGDHDPHLSIPLAVATPLIFALLPFCDVERMGQSWGTGHLANKCEVTQMCAGCMKPCVSRLLGLCVSAHCRPAHGPRPRLGALWAGPALQQHRPLQRWPRQHEAIAPCSGCSRDRAWELSPIVFDVSHPLSPGIRTPVPLVVSPTFH